MRADLHNLPPLVTLASLKHRCLCKSVRINAYYSNLCAPRTFWPSSPFPDSFSVKPSPFLFRPLLL